MSDLTSAGPTPAPHDTVTTADHPCPFCERVAIGDFWNSADERVVRFEPLDPVTPGHMLFVPRRHVEHPERRPLAAAMSAAEAWAARSGGDYNLITSSGPASTMTIPHIHVHYVPRHEGDRLPLPWEATAHVGADWPQRVARLITVPPPELEPAINALAADLRAALPDVTARVDADAETLRAERMTDSYLRSYRDQVSRLMDQRDAALDEVATLRTAIERVSTLWLDLMSGKVPSSNMDRPTLAYCESELRALAAAHPAPEAAPPTGGMTPLYRALFAPIEAAAIAERNPSTLAETVVDLVEGYLAAAPPAPTVTREQRKAAADAISDIALSRALVATDRVLAALGVTVVDAPEVDRG